MKRGAGIAVLRTRTALQTGTGKTLQASDISSTSDFTGVCGTANGRANTAFEKITCVCELLQKTA